MNASLNHSYALCQRLARRAGSNFYCSFWMLPSGKRRAMLALYAFLRRTDDLADNDQPPETRRAAIHQWRDSLRCALTGEYVDELLPALVDTVARYRIPSEYLYAAIEGVEWDVEPRRYETFDELAAYCHRVASVVGLACIHVWGYTSDAAYEPARKCGLAFQLTNILRDLREDAERGRIYLPAEELRQCNYSADDLARGVRDGRFRALMRLQIDRIERLYREAQPLAQYLSRDGRRVLRAMTATYRGLLDEIERRDGDVFSSRVRLSGWQKLRIAARCLCLPDGVARREWSAKSAAG